jgi:hypothetical protein
MPVRSGIYLAHQPMGRGVQTPRPLARRSRPQIGGPGDRRSRNCFDRLPLSTAQSLWRLDAARLPARGAIAMPLSGRLRRVGRRRRHRNDDSWGGPDRGRFSAAQNDLIRRLGRARVAGRAIAMLTGAAPVGPEESRLDEYAARSLEPARRWTGRPSRLSWKRGLHRRADSWTGRRSGVSGCPPGRT